MSTEKEGFRESCITELEAKLRQGQALLTTLAEARFSSVQGIAKLEKKIRQEVKFLSKLRLDQKRLKKEHILCTNLHHLSAIVRVLSDVSDPNEVLKSFDWKDDGVRAKLAVDIVCENELQWVKVVARSAKALDLNSVGGNQFGQKSFIEQVESYIDCANQNPKRFQVPQIIFNFQKGISSGLARKLERKGVCVKGNRIDTGLPGDYNDSSSDSDEEESDTNRDYATFTPIGSILTEESDVDSSKLNLDITAMIAYVSALTNGHANYIFKETILTDQATWERNRPVKPYLDSLFKDRSLICCETANRDFRMILNTLGGDGERQRAEDFMTRVKVVPDRMSKRLETLHSARKIKARSLVIFGTGDKFKVLTVTANSGFVRAAQGQGVDLAVLLHESRALTEDKMKSAVLINA